jgi:hypothetical protein
MVQPSMLIHASSDAEAFIVEKTKAQGVDLGPDSIEALNVARG